MTNQLPPFSSVERALRFGFLPRGSYDTVVCRLIFCPPGSGTSRQLLLNSLANKAPAAS